MRKYIGPPGGKPTGSGDGRESSSASDHAHHLDTPSGADQDRSSGQPTGKQKAPKTAPNKVIGKAAPHPAKAPPCSSNIARTSRKRRRDDTTLSSPSACTSTDDALSPSRQTSSGRRGRKARRDAAADVPMSAALIKSLFDSKFKKLEHNLLTKGKASRRKQIAKKPDFKYKSHAVQHEFNGFIREDLQDALEFLGNKEYSKAAATIQQASKDLKSRNKKITLADRSEAGWRTVELYETDAVASDSADERKIAKAESKALKELEKERNAKEEKGSRSQSSKTDYRSRIRPPFRNASQSPQVQTSNYSGYSGGPICYGCGRRGHIRTNCNYTKQR